MRCSKHYMSPRFYAMECKFTIGISIAEIMLEGFMKECANATTSLSRYFQSRKYKITVSVRSCELTCWTRVCYSETVPPIFPKGVPASTLHNEVVEKFKEREEG